MIRILLLAVVFLSLPLGGVGGATLSPNGKVKVEYVGGNQKEELQVSYKTASGWQTVMTMPVTLSCENVVNKKKVNKVAYDMTLGKRRHCTNAYRETGYPLPDGHQLWVKAYNDGVAWRASCTADKDDAFDGYHVDFSTAQNNWLMKWSDSYEGFFPKNREQKEGERYGYPALFEYGNGIFALLSESCITKECAASSFYGTAKQKEYVIRRDGKEQGGWQTLIIGTLADVVESTLITDNSEPVKAELFANFGAKPNSSTRGFCPSQNEGTEGSLLEGAGGVSSWIYWANNHGSNDFSIIKKYVDMAVELKLPYVLIDAEWDEMPKLSSNNGKTIEDAVKYAVDNGVKPMIWYNSSVGWINGAPTPKFRLNKPEDREREFAWCEKIGVRGVKIDFFSGDNNLNIRYMIELLESAAKHGLLVNFHGVTIPRGWQRTYPNLVSMEAVYGAEWYNNVPTFTNKAAAHNATLPFTRNVIGSMDYTPCAFTDSQHPHITTHAHELALTALYESGIQHLADRPESFLAQPQQVKDYLSNLPTAWDETRLLSGYPGESVVIARRKGSKWYIAGINGTDEKKTLLFDKIKQLKNLGKHKTLFLDSGDKQTPWNIISDNFKKDVPVMLECQPRGGFLMVVE